MKHFCYSCIQLIVHAYIHLYVLLNRLFGIRLRGLGFFLCLLRREYVLNIYGDKLWFNPECAAAYCLLPGGYWNEPETHLFFDRIIPKINSEIAFIDIGASVGEMVIPLAKNKNVRKVIAFEPQAQCALAIEKSAILNNLKNIMVVQCAASEQKGFLRFHSTLQKPTAASVPFSNEDVNQYDNDIASVTVDEIIVSDENLAIIMLIDTEGHEPFVLRGAEQLIRKKCPLIIFEYINPPAKYFSLEDIRNILPSSYHFYRLRGDGHLDTNFNHTWNIVAVSAGTEFEDICKALVI